LDRSEGNTLAAIFLSTLLIHGLTPAPQLFVSQGDPIYTITASFILANIVMYFQGRFVLKLVDKIIDTQPAFSCRLFSSFH
jgi:putative tricarboxylic transport membrane protein